MLHGDVTSNRKYMQEEITQNYHTGRTNLLIFKVVGAAIQVIYAGLYPFCIAGNIEIQCFVGLS